MIARAKAGSSEILDSPHGLSEGRYRWSGLVSVLNGHTPRVEATQQAGLVDGPSAPSRCGHDSAYLSIGASDSANARLGAFRVVGSKLRDSGIGAVPAIHVDVVANIIGSHAGDLGVGAVLDRKLAFD